MPSLRRTPEGLLLALQIALPGQVNTSNAAMAVAAAATLGIAPAVSNARLGRVGTVEGRYSVRHFEGREVRLLLAKNPAGWSELLDVLQEGNRAAIIAINAPPADGLDPSWLWDVPFERLAGRPVIVLGERAWDLSTRQC